VAAIYTADSFALAMLERLVYVLVENLPPEDHWVTVSIPDDAVETIEAPDVAGWDSLPPTASRHFGDRWLVEGRSLALSVPSVVTRIDRNLVLNPAHPRFGEVAVGTERPVAWDRRLFGR
jgi:RES domain-containing protein